MKYEMSYMRLPPDEAHDGRIVIQQIYSSDEGKDLDLMESWLNHKYEGTQDSGEVDVYDFMIDNTEELFSTG